MKILTLKSDGNGKLQLIERDDLEDEGCSFEAIEKLIAQGINAGDIKKLQDAGIRNSFEAIDKLIAQGINAGDIKKLQDAGLHNWNQFMMRTKKDFTGVKGLSEEKVEKIFDTVCEAKDKVAKKEILKITSGSSVLDEHLGVFAQGINAGDIKKLQDAGVYTVSETAENTAKKEIVKITSGAKPSFVTEAFGEFRSGQPQLAHTHCAPKQIFVKTIAGKTLCFSVKSEEIIFDLKRKIEEKETFPIQQQRLIFAGKELSDSVNISDDKFYNEATIYLTSGLCGGSRKRGKDINKGLRKILMKKDKEIKEEISIARMLQGKDVYYCAVCDVDPPLSKDTVKELLEHYQEFHPQDYMALKERILEEEEKRAKEKKEIEELAAQIVSLSGQGSSSTTSTNSSTEHSTSTGMTKKINGK